MNWDRWDWFTVLFGWATGFTALAVLPEHWRLIAVFIAFSATWVVRTM